MMILLHVEEFRVVFDTGSGQLGRINGEAHLPTESRPQVYGDLNSDSTSRPEILILKPLPTLSNALNSPFVNTEEHYPSCCRAAWFAVSCNPRVRSSFGSS